MRRSRAQEINEEENEIEGMSKKLHKKNKNKNHSHKISHKVADEDMEDASQDNAEEESSPLVNKAKNVHKEIRSMHDKHDSKKNHLHVKKNAKKAAVADSKAEMAADEDSDMEEPIAHEKDMSADSLDKTQKS